MPVPSHTKPDACEICGKVKKLNADHDHETGKFRGWLCTRCNVMLAACGDNLAGVLRVQGYINRHGQLLQ
jgi:hypothetical protein